MNTNNNKFIHNPYIFGIPIKKKEQLYGREDTFLKIEYNLTNNLNITLLHVQRRIGKTSLITCLPQFFTEEQNHFEFVSFSFQGHKEKPIPEILNQLAYAIADQINGLPQQVRELADNNNEDNFFQVFLRKVVNQYLYLSGKKLVLLLDEFDVLGEDENEDISKGKKIFDKLEKALKQEEDLFAILVFGRPVKDMAYLEIFLEKQKIFLEKQTPILENQILIEVGLLDRDSTNKLIVEPAQKKLEYEKDAIDEIYRLSTGHPSLTQLLCYCIFNSYRGKKDRKVSKNDISSVLDEAMERGRGILEGFLQPLKENEKLFFRAVAEAQENPGDKQLQANIKNWQPVGKRLVEKYRFLEDKEDKTGYKVKVELVRLWLVQNYPLSNEEKRQMRESPPQETNRIAKIFSFFLVFGLIGGTVFFTIYQVHISRDNRRSRNDCDSLLEEINKANDEEKQLQVIQKVREEWSRETETLYKKCPYPNTIELDAKYNKLLDRYGQKKVDSKEYGEAIEAWCEVSGDEYEKFSRIEIIFKRWILEPGRIPNEDKQKVMAKLIEQNQSPNGCPAYSFEDDTNKFLLYEQVEELNKFYYQEAQTYIKDYEFDKAVDSYCKITEDYENFDDIVKELEEWYHTNNYSNDFYESEQKLVQDKLKNLGNQCPASPLNTN